jgi:hypothetical protein
LELLLSTECVQHSFFSFGHSYGGASKFQKAYGRLEPLENNTEWSFLLADPLDIGELQALSAKTEVSSNSVTVLQSVLCSSCSFETLPNEIMVSVLCLLPSKDIANLRLASRPVAMISTMSQLPQSFWASRFGPGMELGFFHPVSMTKRRDWRSLYFKIKSRLEHEPALKNRKRIWDSMQPVAELGESYSRRCLYGIRHDLSALSHMNSLINGPLLLAQTITATSVPEESKEQITFGCRQTDHRMAIIPEFFLAPQAYPLCWCYNISFITINGRSYASGVQFIPPTFKCDEEIPANSLGYINTGNRLCQEFKAPGPVNAVGIAVCPRGIVDIQFVSNSEAAMAQKNYADMHDIAFGHLLPKGDDKITGITVGVDVPSPLSLL